MSRILDSIDDPTQLRALTIPQMVQLAQEIRSEIIEKVSVRGGHLAPNLGVVELTMALHAVFHTPDDLLVWDIGHQAYVHKLLTGRRERFHTIRQFGGLSGYLRREESPYDVFGASHASTSISAALGLAAARDLQGKDFKVVAIIGDGALTGGMALEALNNAGSLKKNLIIVLNDNEKSISDNVGALHHYLGEVRRLQTTPSYRRLREMAKESIEKLPVVGDMAREAAGRAETSLKQFVMHSKSGAIFEELGIKFFGPFDGHDLPLMLDVFENVRQIAGPVIVQMVTTKGKGWEVAEKDSTKWHGPGAFDYKTGTIKKNPTDPPTYTEVFANTLVALAEQDPTIVGITAAMAEGTGLKKLHQRFPERYFDVGIAEQHAVTFAAGLAVGGLRPVTAIYSTFLQRAYDQVVHDVCMQNLHVVFAMDRAGIVGEDGPTQHGVFDIAFLRTIPRMQLMAPKDEEELRHMLYTAIYMDGPVALRYPRGKGAGVPLGKDLVKLEVGKAELISPQKLEHAVGSECAILAYGSTVAQAEVAARELAEEGIQVAVVNARWAKPLDEELILRLARGTRRLVTIEDHMVAGGFGSAVLELLEKHGLLHEVDLRLIGLPDKLVEHGAPTILKELYGLSSAHLKEVIREMLGSSRRTLPSV
ncbi:1-deoxy-D-xylulose-5-phosphate synthase [Ktedonosporobacter rubrisoli]|uniref:1-deoxy-D-xylulose-5-phosphate synthase n=1 Tax=Ktedonosporobacter rubrisoli TaxID=2509675 RepID=A0A4P6JT13_KTERU|nr:1-deoxy-D-xylulose-5-phosphate synthase [Ktedonosporobacter rubrisoli]QBD78420.1 1-deoxy-D-xylulose-5-phosphate synthase [Ktedonosporobacter rubrisoli]